MLSRLSVCPALSTAGNPSSTTNPAGTDILPNFRSALPSFETRNVRALLSA